MASVLDLVKHYQQAIEKHPNDEERVLRCIDKLYQLKVTTHHLQETGVGRTVNALRKEPGDVGKAARSLVYKWKLMVAAEESDQEGDHKTDNITEACTLQEELLALVKLGGFDLRKWASNSPELLLNVRANVEAEKHNGHSSGKESDDNTQSRSNKYDQYRNENPSSVTKREYEKGTNGHHSRSKRKYNSSEEEEPNSKKIRDFRKGDIQKVVIKQEKLSDNESEDDSKSSDSDSNSEYSESSREEIIIKKEIKQEYDVKEEIKTESPESHKSSSSKHNDRHREYSSKHSHETERRDHERSKSKESSRHSSDTKSSSHKHKSSSDKNEHDTSEKHKSHHKTEDQKKDSRSNKSSSEKHRSSSQKRESNSDKHKNNSDRNGSDKHSSKSDKHRSSSHSDREKESDKHKSSDKNSKQSSYESSSSREKYSSSSKDKSKDRTNASSEKSSHISEKKSSSGSKSDDKSKRREKSKDKSSSSHRVKSSSSSKEEVPKKKSKQDGGNSDDGIDCGSGASFAEALGMISPAKPKKKTYKDLSPNTSDLSPAALLAPTAKLAPLPALEISALPEISPNYRPRPPPKLLPHFTDEEAISAGISSKNQRTKVYSGNKVVGKVTSLYEMCVQVLQEHIDALEYTGGVPYEILKPVVDRATPQQLFLLEHYNPYLMEDTDHLWQKFCEKSFRNKRRQEMETWREMYMRCQEEQECKLKSLTANIKMTQEAKKAPIKQTKMAYVDSVVKPPRNIARKQALHGTAHAAAASPAARVASLAGASNVLKGGVRPVPAASVSSTTFNKPKKAPLMQKALQFMRGRKR